MTFQHTFSDREIFEIYKLSQRRMLILWGLIMGIVLAYRLAALPQVSVANYPQFFSPVIFIFLIAGLSNMISYRKLKKAMKDLGSVTISVTGKGIDFKSQGREGLTEWSNMTGFREGKNILLCSTRHRYQLIPLPVAGLSGRTLQLVRDSLKPLRF